MSCGIFCWLENLFHSSIGAQVPNFPPWKSPGHVTICWHTRRLSGCPYTCLCFSTFMMWAACLVVRYVLFFDALVNYLSSVHLSYALLTFSVIATFNVLLKTIVLFYQCPRFQRVLGYLHLNRHELVTFVNTLQGQYKNRLNHERSYHFFAGIYLVIPTMSIVLFCLVVSSGLVVVIGIITTNVVIAACFYANLSNSMTTTTSIQSFLFVYPRL